MRIPLSALVVIVYTMLLTGCGTSMTVKTVMGNQVYQRDCMGPNSKHSWRDPVCQHMGEPVVQNGMAQYRVSGVNLNDPRLRIWCQKLEDGMEVPEQVTESVCRQIRN